MILYDNKNSWGHGDGYVVLWALINELVIEVVYEETMIHSTKIIWEMLAREEW